jgi:Ni,Fe-hydrogenase maturation factor
LRDICGVEIVIIACQPANIPKEIMQGLSEPLKRAVSQVSDLIYNKYLKHTSDGHGSAISPLSSIPSLSR